MPRAGFSSGGGASGTTVGTALLNLTNPSAITFIRVNADNSVTALSASAMLTALGAMPLAGGTFTGDVLFTDASFDIGKLSATRPRDLFVSRSVTIAGDGASGSGNGLNFTGQTITGGAQTATLTASPVAGNPAAWLPVVVNGTTRKIPAW